jgi:hypothetical protein
LHGALSSRAPGATGAERRGSVGPLPLVACVTLGLFLLAGVVTCGEPEAPPPEAEEARIDWIVDRHFSGDVDPRAEVARVDGDSITVGEIALCLEGRPVLTVQGCLDQLVDTRLVTRRATEADRRHPRVEEAEVTARAQVLLREAVERPVEERGIPEDEVDAFVHNPDHRIFFSSPEYRIASHLLVRGDSESPVVNALAARIEAETDWSRVETLADLRRLRERYNGVVAEEGLQDVDVIVDAHVQVPDPRYIFDERFVDALFALDPEASAPISGPVRSDFGVHFILLEEVRPAQELDPAEARAIARAELQQRARVEAFQALAREVTERVEVMLIPDNVAILQRGDEEILRRRSAEIREAMRQSGPPPQPQ